MRLFARASLAATLVGTAAPSIHAQPLEQLIGASGPTTYERLNPVQQHVHLPSQTPFSTDVLVGGDTPPLVGQWFDPPDWTLSRLTATGAIVWQARLAAGDSGYVGPSSIAVLSDGSAVVSGSAADGTFGPTNIGVVRVSAAGAVLWTTRIAGASDYSAIAALPGDISVVVGSNVGSSVVTFLSGAGAVLSSSVLTLGAPYHENFFLTDVKYDVATGTVLMCGWANDNVTFDTVGVLIRMSTAGAVLGARRIDATDAFSNPINFELLALEPIPGGLAIAVASDIWNNDDPEFPFTISAPMVVGLSAAFTPTWVTQFSSPGADFLRPRQSALRRHPSGVLGLIGQYSFGDGGSRVWLARFDEITGAYQGRRQYGGSANTFPGGLTPMLDAAHPWAFVGGIQTTFSTSDGYHVVTRPDGTTGCDELMADTLSSPALVNGPLVVNVTAAAPVAPWSPTVLPLAFDRASVCNPEPPCPCNLADITQIGGTFEEPGSPDCQLTLDDILLFNDAYIDGSGCPGSAPCNPADVTDIGESGAGPDGLLTLDDILAFSDAYNAGC